MKRKIFIVMIVIINLMILNACTSKSISSDPLIQEKNFYKSGSTDENYVELFKVNDNIWVHTTYANYNGYRTPSNGVIVVTTDGIVMIDTPWNNQQTKELLKLTKDVFNRETNLAIITHAHEDRIGGIDTLIENEIEARSTSLTAEEAHKYGFKRPQPSLDNDPTILIGEVAIEVFYPGEGHTIDNITIWFPQYKILFGGCLIKALESKDLGNVEDANLQQWPYSVRNVLEKYSEAEVVIPGHGKWGNLDLVKHTLELTNK